MGDSKHRQLVSEEIDLIFSSATASGARNKTADGSSFNIQLEEGLQIPKDARNVNLQVETATIWNVSPNIITGTNDQLYITCPRESDSASTVYQLTIPQGLYSLSDLNQAIQRELSNAGAKITPDACVTLLADTATNKTEFRFNYTGIEIDFTQTDTFRDVLGFNSQVVGPNATAPLIYLADNVADFAVIEYYLIHSDLVNRGVRFNNNYSQIISQVLITAPPGSQIVHTPFHPAKSNAQDLAGNLRRNIKFWLTDQDDNLVSTNSEDYSVGIKITYQIPQWI
jgi:hypothetical protein